MQVIVESSDSQAPELRELAVRRVRFALRRLAWLVPRARIRLSVVAGGHSGVDKRCQVELMSVDREPVVVTSIARHWHVAVQSAVSRAAASLLRHWDRKRQRRSTLPRALGMP